MDSLSGLPELEHDPSARDETAVERARGLREALDRSAGLDGLGRVDADVADRARSRRPVESHADRVTVDHAHDAAGDAPLEPLIVIALEQPVAGGCDYDHERKDREPAKRSSAGHRSRLRGGG